MIGVTIDVTQRHELEERLRRSQRLEAVGQLASGIAHDFNNLLTVVGGHAALLVDELEEGDRRSRHTAEILGASQRAAKLTQQLLAFSGRQILQPEWVDVTDLVENCRSLLLHIVGEAVELRTTLEAALPPVLADAAQLELVLVNLVLNARDAMPHGGEITISTAAVDDGAAVRIVVGDTGYGMSAEVSDRAIEPFFTTKPVGKGTGLGLATANGIVEQSNGTLEIESEPGRGTAVVITFPADTDAK